MSAYFELIDLDSGNLLGIYDTEGDALKVVHDTVAAYGRDHVEFWGLGRVDDEGGSSALASGPQLVTRAAQLQPTDGYGTI